MALIARGQITISTVSDGANSINIYSRSQSQPSTPTGTTPVGWSANASTLDNSYWTLWVSSAIKNADGSLEAPWSKPVPIELHDSNALGRFPFVVGTGAQSPYAPYSSTNNIREQGLNPFGVNDVLWRGKSQISTGWCGGFCLSSSRYVPVDNSKQYRFSCWVKRNTWSEGYVYFGVNGAVENGTSWSSNSNYYVAYIPTTTLLETNKWYFVVGYIYPSGSENAKVDVRAGVYDPITGNRVMASSYFCRQKIGVKSLGFRISQYRCTTTNPEVHFWQPRIDLCDGRELSIEELVKKNPITPTVNISGEDVFKFRSGATVPIKTSLPFSANLSSGLVNYQWQYSTGSSWGTITGATRSSYSLAYNYSAWGSHSSLRIRCVSTLAGKIYYSNEITVTKVYDGAIGPSGEDSNMLDWVEDWNTSKTVINSNSVITPKIFAGVKNANNTVTGIALGHFSLTTRNVSGALVTETIDGIYGFRDGYKTFSVDSEGSTQLGRGSQSIKYNAISGRVEFGSAVALAWVGATYIDANGIFTGRLSADSIKAITLSATQITSGTISASRIDVNALKATLITAGNINALTLTVIKGKIGDWSINSDSIYRGTKVNISGRYTGASGAITIGSAGIRGYKWRLDATGAGAIAGGNISWDSNGVLTFSSSVSLNWTNAATNALNSAKSYADTKKTEAINSAASDATNKANTAQKNAEDKAKELVSFKRYSSTSVELFNVASFDKRSSSSGLYRIQTPINTAWMTQMEIEGYNYSTKSSFKCTLSFYNYTTSIINRNAVYSGNVPLTQIRIGKKNGVCVIELQCGLKSYPKLYVSNVKLSYSTVPDSVKNGWSISEIASFSTDLDLMVTVPVDDIITDIANAEQTGIDAQAIADAITRKAQNEGWSTKLTYIDSQGIFTGRLSANCVQAITINATQITSGLIHASYIDAASIKASIINVGYINGLSCTFNKGTIGGWRIGSDNMAIGSIGGALGIQLRTTSTGSGYWYSGAYKPYGISITWHRSNNAGHIVFGQIAASSGSAKTGFIGIQMMSHDNLEYFCLSTNHGRTGSKEVYNRIAGWAFDSTRIWKNSVSLGSDGSIYNGSKWRLNNDGSGSIASGNISWNSGGAVTFSSAVSLNWKNDIEAAKTANYGYRYYKRIVINGESSTFYPVVFKGGDQTIKRDILIRRSYSEQAPSDWYTSTHKGGLILLLKTNFGGWGGASYSWDIYELSEVYCRMFAGAALVGNSCMFSVFLRGGGTTGAVYHLYSDQPIENSSYSPVPIPHAPQIAYNSDLIFKSGNYESHAPAPRTLTTSVEAEIRKRRFITLAQSSDTTLTEHPLTYIGSTGIYTGTLTALQVNAVAISANSITTGTLSANCIAAGSITSTKLDANSIKANIINTSYINGLSCTFSRGTIGGWRIGSSDITTGSIASVGSAPIQLRSAASGSGYWYAGSYKPYGLSMLWYQSSNAGHIVFGQIAASGNSVKTGFMGLQMLSWDGHEYFCLSANTLRSGSKEVYNRIAGWAFDRNRIWKNSVSLGSDGSIYNGNKWRLNNDGSGRLANGNIVWNASGTVTFGSSVSLNWTNAANNALNQAKSYANTKKTEAISAAASDATNKANAAKELASAMASGRMIYRDPTFYNGANSVNVYNNSGNGTVTISRVYNSTAPNDSKYVLRVQNNGSSSPQCGGFYFGTTCSYRKVFITRIIAKIPVGRSIIWASNSIGSGGSSKWLTATNGTGDWCEYIYKVICGTSSFSSTNFYYLSGAYGVTWDIAYATVFDVTSVEKSTTTIDANGIYTASLNANQITAGTIHASRIDTNSIKTSILTATNINALTLTINRGSIGGWNITSTQISKNSVALTSDGSIVNGTKWRLNRDGSGQLANGAITWNTAGKFTATGGVFDNVRINGSMRSHFVKNDSSIWIGGNTSTQNDLKNFDNVIAVRGSWDENINLSWTLEDSGRKICIVNYKWNSTITQGYMTITAPSGKYFYEDGIAKRSIKFSREVIELMGYGDNRTFFGWIVTNRMDIMTSGKYGSNLRYLAQGTVTLSGTSVSTRYITFDGSRSLSVHRSSVGRYIVYLPWSLSGKYYVMLTGLQTGGGPRYACTDGIYNSYFYVNVQDDASRNEGGFNFIVVSNANWQ